MAIKKSKVLEARTSKENDIVTITRDASMSTLNNSYTQLYEIVDDGVAKLVDSRGVDEVEDEWKEEIVHHLLEGFSEKKQTIYTVLDNNGNEVASKSVELPDDYASD